MWILESDGDLLGGKRVWLKPGKKYLFGRIKQDGVRHVIQHQSISRKHLVIEVSPVQPGDGAHVHKKSKLIVFDQGSKCGTTVDGVEIKGSSMVLTGDEHSLQLGRYPPAIRIKWQPIVLSFSFSTKELKAKDPLGPVRTRLEELDIKTIIPYVDKTTHVVQNKRNTAKGLQALVNAKYIVKDTYIDALVYAATPGDLETAESFSPLEIDFDANWPDPALHLPPAGKEPVQRPSEAFAPNTARTRVFEGYTFVFGDPSQYENLSNPINNGHGKSLLYNIENGQTTSDDLLRFIRSASSEKELDTPRNNEGRVVLVRFRAKGYEDWSIDLSNQVALQMDQRVIEQSEFLDAILNNDASSLFRRLPREKSSVLHETLNKDHTEQQSMENVSASKADASLVTATQQNEVDLSENSQITETKYSGRSQIRPFVSRMKKFDDGFDTDVALVYQTEASGVSHDEDKLPPENQVKPLKQQPATSMRGGEEADEEYDDDEDDDMSGLLPGASAMKRRRGEDSRSFHEEVVKEETPKPKRQKVDVIAAARRHREEEEAAALKQRQNAELNMQDVIDGMTLEDMKNLVIVEEFEVPTRAREPVVREEPERWDERWNGRKNFKKFRRKGDQAVGRSRIQAVIVPLDEVKRKEYGIGDHYWTSHDRDDSPEPIFRRTSQQQSVQKSTSTSATPSQISLTISEEASSVNRTRSHVSATPTGTQPSQGTGHKRRRETRNTADEDDEELRFKFRRRRR